MSCVNALLRTKNSKEDIASFEHEKTTSSSYFFLAKICAVHEPFYVLRNSRENNCELLKYSTRISTYNLESCMGLDTGVTLISA